MVAIKNRKGDFMRRFISGILIFLMVIGNMVLTVAAADTNADVWAASSMQTAYEKGFISQEDLLDAKSKISRLDFCKIVVQFYEQSKGVALTPQNESPFEDCADPAVVAAYEAKIISGTEPNRFAPDASLTREQLAIMLNRVLRACGLELPQSDGNLPFTDTAKLMEGSVNAIGSVWKAGILSGDEDNSFYPMRALTLQEAVVGFVNAYEYYENNAPFQLPAQTPTEEPVPEIPVETEKQPEATNPPAEQVEKEYDTVYINSKPITLGATVSQLQAEWGEPDRIDATLYALERYIYIQDYERYFFVTLRNGKIIEIYTPTRQFNYLGTQGGGTTADIVEFDYISSVEHSAIIETESTHARIPLDYEGKTSGLLLQSRDYNFSNEIRSGLTMTLREDLTKEFLDLIQVKRKEQGIGLVNENLELTIVALAHSDDMVRNNYFDYTGSDGTSPFSRIQQRQISFKTASEVIIRQRGDVVNIYQQCIRTPAQINGILDSSMDSVGIGVAQKGRDLYITFDFCGGINK